MAKTALRLCQVVYKGALEVVVAFILIWVWVFQYFIPEEKKFVAATAKRKKKRSLLSTARLNFGEGFFCLMAFFFCE